MTDVIIVFGGSGDIGREICEVFANDKYQVIASYHKRKPKRKNVNIKYFYFDASKGGKIPDFLNKKSFHIVGIFFCVGMASSKMSIMDTSINEFLLLNEVNALSFIKIMHKLRKSIERDAPYIIILNSEAVLKNSRNSAPYSASKSYLHSLVATLKKELINMDTKVEEIFLPPVEGNMMTEIARKAGYNTLDEYVKDKLNGKILCTKQIAIACKQKIDGNENAIKFLLDDLKINSAKK